MTEVENALPPAAARNKGGRPKGAKTKRRSRARVPAKALLENPKTRALIDKAVEEKFQALMATLGVKREAATEGEGSIGDGDMRLVRQLAVAIGEVSDQGAKVKRVAPAELEARDDARKKMEDLILDAIAEGKIASYDLTREVFLDEQLVQPTYVNPSHVRCVQSIEWPGVPDESMRPTNDTAKAIYTAFIRSIGGRTKEAKVPYKHASQAPRLKVVGADGGERGAPDVGKPRMSEGLRVLRPNAPGEVVRTNVLGTLAEPARQIG